MKGGARAWTPERTTFLLIAIGGLYLGVRSERAARGVNRAPEAGPAAAADSALAGMRSDLRRIASAESLLTARPESLIDPFAQRVEAPRAPVAAATRAEEPLVIPAIGGLLYDAVAPVVQLRIGGQRSDWLHPGDVFQGWRVAEIFPASVRIQKNGRTVDVSQSIGGQ